MKFLKEVTYIRYVIAKLSRFIQISMQTSSNSQIPLPNLVCFWKSEEHVNILQLVKLDESSKNSLQDNRL